MLLGGGSQQSPTDPIQSTPVKKSISRKAEPRAAAPSSSLHHDRAWRMLPAPTYLPWPHPKKSHYPPPRIDSSDHRSALPRCLSLSGSAYRKSHLQPKQPLPLQRDPAAGAGRELQGSHGERALTPGPMASASPCGAMCGPTSTAVLRVPRCDAAMFPWLRAPARSQGLGGSLLAL